MSFPNRVHEVTTKRFSAIEAESTVASTATPADTVASAAAADRVEVLFKSLSLSQQPPPPSLPPAALEFVEKLQKATKVIVLVGAGASVSAGIPDFRTPGTGLYSQLEAYNLPTPKEMWPGGKYKPTLAHYFIKLMHDKNKLLRVFTQNIDSLEHCTGLGKHMIVPAHGNFDSAACVITKKPVPIDEAKHAHLTDDFEALNRKHGTVLVKPSIVFFGEALPERFYDQAMEDFPQCDLLLVMGTSLKVEPFASLIERPRTTVPRMLINREVVGTWLDGGFDFRSKKTRDVLLQGDCDAGCLSLAQALGWEAELQALLSASN
ncbi:hypothetical protein BASA81_002769 [Batrachochytrium salamandrivorans]|nr:hypothetical protein BASA81_002769 [Batrachochytrium salamandrivorans]